MASTATKAMIKPYSTRPWARFLRSNTLAVGTQAECRLDTHCFTFG
jgi:hypothetical protein